MHLSTILYTATEWNTHYTLMQSMTSQQTGRQVQNKVWWYLGQLPKMAKNLMCDVIFSDITLVFVILNGIVISIGVRDNWQLTKCYHRDNWGQCTMCTLYSFFSFRPSEVRLILKSPKCYTIQHKFVPACSVERNMEKIRLPWASNSKFVIFSQIFPRSNYKICPIIPL